MDLRNRIRACLAVVTLAATPVRAQGLLVEQPLTKKLDALIGRPHGLTADKVAERAVATSFDVQSKRQEVAAAAADANRAAINFAPRLTTQASYTRLSPIDATQIGTLRIDSPTDQTVFEQKITVPILDYAMRLPSELRAAQRQRDGAVLTERATRLQIGADARVVYYSWARARLQTAVAEQSLAQARQHLESVASLFEAGSSSRADVMRVEAQVASSELFLARARNNESVLDDQLRTIMHDDSGVEYEIGEDLRPIENGPAASPSHLVAKAHSSRLEIKSFDESIRAAQAKADATRAGMLPRLDGFAELTTANPNSRYLMPPDSFERTWAAGLQLSWSPNDFFSSRSAARAADARAVQLQAQRGSLRDQVRSEVEQDVAEMRRAQTSIGATERGLQAAEESYRVRRELFLNGRATSVELIDAQTELTQARLDAISARIDQQIARVRLEHATGTDLSVAD